MILPEVDIAAVVPLNTNELHGGGVLGQRLLAGGSGLSHPVNKSRGNYSS
jgi:hypothetical protein